MPIFADAEIVDWLIIVVFCRELKGTWVDNVLDKNLFIDFARLSSTLTSEVIVSRQERTKKLVKKIEESINQSPDSRIGKKLAYEWYALNQEIYADYPELKKAIVKAYWEGKIPNMPYSKKVALDFSGNERCRIGQS